MALLNYTLLFFMAWQFPAEAPENQGETLSGNWKLISIFVDKTMGLQVRPEDFTDEQCMIRFTLEDEVPRFSGRTNRNQIFGNYKYLPIGDNYDRLIIEQFGSTKVMERGFGGLMLKHLPSMNQILIHKDLDIMELKSPEGVIFQLQKME